MEGGRGNDTYVVDTPGDTITELPKGGVDTVLSAFSFTLPDQVENLTLSGTGAADGAGNELANILVGNDAANRLDGGAGKDLLLGGAGNDHLESGGGKDKLDGGAGDDELFAGSRSSLTGGADADSFVLGPDITKVKVTDFTSPTGTCSSFKMSSRAMIPQPATSPTSCDSRQRIDRSGRSGP